MGFAFLDRWQSRRDDVAGMVDAAAAVGPGSLGEMLADCELLREQAQQAGQPLDDSPASLQVLDQLLPEWRDDPDTSEWLGNDAGLYLGTVIVRTVEGAVWQLHPEGRLSVALAGGREIDVVAMGHSWAAEGFPELSWVYTELSSGWDRRQDAAEPATAGASAGGGAPGGDGVPGADGAAVGE